MYKTLCIGKEKETFLLCALPLCQCIKKKKKKHNHGKWDYTITLALSMLRNSGVKKKKTGSKYDFSIRRMDLKTIKNTLGRVTCSVNWREDNSCKSSWCGRLNLKLLRIWTMDCSSWVLIDWHQLGLYICFFLWLLAYVMSFW